MRSLAYALLIALVLTGTAWAQSPGDFQIKLQAFTVSRDGGEKALGLWYGTGPLVIGKPRPTTFSFASACEAFAVSSDGSLIDDATVAWSVELTPLQVVKDAVTFRLRWIRVPAPRQPLNQVSLDGKVAGATTEDLELTLRPGESWPMDSVAVPPGAKTSDGRPCGAVSSIRASVDSYPWEEEEHRLVAADLWLIERLASGAEVPRSEPVSVRVLPNRPFRFYFDSLVDTNVTLDIYGTLVSRLQPGAIALSLETRSRWSPGSPRFRGPQRLVESAIQVRPAEIVEIRLPLLGDDAGPFAKRAYSIRVRARQLR